MSIKITFEGLCAFFTKDIPKQRLIVGLVEVSDSDLPLSEFHIPKIQIKEEGSDNIVAEYTGISGKNCLKGDVFLHLISANGLVAPDLFSELGQNDNPALLDIEKDLYSGEPLKINPQMCRALLNINNGVLSQNEAYPNNIFENLLFYELLPDSSMVYLANLRVNKKLIYSAQIDVEVPERGYAVLHFNEGADDFVFRYDRDYKMAVTCLSEESLRLDNTSKDHFKYYYKLAENNPSRIIIPKMRRGGDNGRPECMHGEFGNTP